MSEVLIYGSALNFHLTAQIVMEKVMIVHYFTALIPPSVLSTSFKNPMQALIVFLEVIFIFCFYESSLPYCRIITMNQCLCA